MRLIDKDALCKKLQAEIGSPEGHKKLMRINYLITHAPSVDAIPVDWIVQRMSETSSGSGLNIELNHALFAVGVEWERWKKEHGMEAEE